MYSTRIGKFTQSLVNYFCMLWIPPLRPAVVALSSGGLEALRLSGPRYDTGVGEDEGEGFHEWEPSCVKERGCERLEKC